MGNDPFAQPLEKCAAVLKWDGGREYPCVRAAGHGGMHEDSDEDQWDISWTREQPVFSPKQETCTAFAHQGPAEGLTCMRRTGHTGHHLDDPANVLWVSTYAPERISDAPRVADRTWRCGEEFRTADGSLRECTVIKDHIGGHQVLPVFPAPPADKTQQTETIRPSVLQGILNRLAALEEHAGGTDSDTRSLVQRHRDLSQYCGKLEDRVAALEERAQMRY